MKPPTHPNTFVARVDIKAMTGFSRQHVSKLVEAPDFPAPVDEVMKSDRIRQPIWYRSDVERWMADRGYKLITRPPSLPAKNHAVSPVPV